MITPQKALNSGLGPSTTAQEIAKDKNLKGQVVVITGGHSGIGFETTQAFVTAGAQVIVGARDLEKAKDKLSGLKGVELLKLDLSLSESISEFAKQITSKNIEIDFLINNAGIMATPLMRDSRGIEMQFATNHLGHFQLTQNLFQSLKPGARIVNLTSAGHRFGGVDFQDPNFNEKPYDKWKAYGQSKTANSLFTIELDQRAKQAKGIRAFAVHPGRILETDLTRSLSEEELKPFGITRDSSGQIKDASGAGLKNSAQGAATTMWCALSQMLTDEGGVYCADCDISELVADDSQSPTGVRKWAIDPDLAVKLWELSEKMTGIQFL